MTDTAINITCISNKKRLDTTEVETALQLFDKIFIKCTGLLFERQSAIQIQTHRDIYFRGNL